MEERIREIEFGILDGLTSEGIKARFPQEHKRRKREGKYWYRPPGGESRPGCRAPSTEFPWNVNARLPKEKRACRLPQRRRSGLPSPPRTMERGRLSQD